MPVWNKVNLTLLAYFFSKLSTKSCFQIQLFCHSVAEKIRSHNSFGQNLLLVSLHGGYSKYLEKKVDQSGILGVHIQKYVSLTVMFKVNIDYKACFARRNTYLSFIH